MLDRPRDIATPPAAGRGRPGPVVLATLSVRIDANAERVAFESAIEAGVALVVANMITMPSYPTTLMLAPEFMTLPQELGLDAACRRAGLLVLGPEVRLISRMRLRAATRLVRRRAECLVWIVPDG